MTEAISMQQASTHVFNCQNALAEARAAADRATRAVRLARSRCADAITGWQAAFPPPTRSETVKDGIMADHARRLAEAGSQGPPRPEVTYIDRVGQYASGGNADDFTRAQFRHGGNHRGAYPKSMKGRMVK
jgi:hypothetical protein